VSELGVDSDTVLHDLDADGVLTLTLNRPDRNNAWSVEMERALHQLLFQASASADVRTIVLTGAGRSFCPGFDSQSLEQSAGGSSPSSEGRTQITLPAAIPKPIVCAINGACAGVGLATALACDVRFAAEGAKLATSFSKRGLPAEEGVSWALPRIIGHAAALELLLSSRPITGADAASRGMVHRALPHEDLMPVALGYARDLARTCSPLAMAAIKRQVYTDWMRTLTETRDAARLLMNELRTHADFHEGVMSLVERRPPRFPPYAEVLDPAAFPIEPT
jgi:enoyl-CoA hydratase/carnithine racemase